MSLEQAECFAKMTGEEVVLTEDFSYSNYTLEPTDKREA